MRRTKKEILSHIDPNTIENSHIVGRNTLEITYKNGNRAIRFHDTDIITFKKDGDIILTTGGWHTITTKERLSKPFSPFYITSRKGIWYINETIIFYDGIVLNEKGEVKSEQKTIDFKKINKIKKDIKKYISIIDTIETLPLPNNGDCWHCLFHDKDNRALGDLTKDTDHLRSHIEEGYIHGSILVNAMRERGYREEQIGYHYQMNLRDTFKRALRRYLNKKLLAEI
jgi:hypothetical protein